MTYKLLRKTRKSDDYEIMSYCPTREMALKIIELYKKRKIIKLGEKRSLMKTSKWQIVPITRYEAMMAQKDVPF